MYGLDTDNNQIVFKDFSVPDKIRITKIKKWLNDHGYLKNQTVSILEIGYCRNGLLDNLQEYTELKKFTLDINVREHKDDIKFIQHDCNLDFPNFNGELFDIVFAGEVIEHIFDDAKFLKNIYKILKPNGLIVLTTPNLFFSVNRLLFPFGKMPYFAYAPYHYHFYSVPILTELVSRCGFSIRQISSSHILFSTRRNKIFGKLFELMGNICPRMGAHIILFASKPEI